MSAPVSYSDGDSLGLTWLHHEPGSVHLRDRLLALPQPDALAGQVCDRLIRSGIAHCP